MKGQQANKRKKIPKELLERLKYGREFQDEVQAFLKKETKGGGAEREIEVVYEGETERKKGQYGRMDIYLDDKEHGYIVIYEIKATNWDKIREENILKNIESHGRQLHKYIEKFVNEDNDTVVHGVIYTKPPKSKELRKLIEDIAIDTKRRTPFPVYWFSEMK